MTATQQVEAPTVTSPEQAAQILGVALTADPQVVQQAYRRAARQAHPDAGGAAGAFEQVHNAYELLLWRAENPEQARVHARVVVWVRARVRPWPVLFALVQGSTLIATAALFSSAALMWAAIGVAAALLVQALWMTGGRSPRDREYWRQRAGQWRHRRAGDQWETGPIPAMTDERMREFEETGE